MINHTLIIRGGEKYKELFSKLKDPSGNTIEGLTPREAEILAIMGAIVDDYLETLLTNPELKDSVRATLRGLLEAQYILPLGDTNNNDF